MGDVKIRLRKACSYPNLRSFGWVSYDKVGVLYSGKLGSRSEARASDLRSYPGPWWERIKLHLYEGNESEYSPRTCSIGRPAGGTLCPPPLTSQFLTPHECRLQRLLECHALCKKPTPINNKRKNRRPINKKFGQQQI